MITQRATFQAIGTHWNIQIHQPLDDDAWTHAMDELLNRIDEFDTVYSRFRSDSLVTEMSQKAGRYELPADAYPLLKFYEQLYRATDGKITPLIGQTVAAAGYNASYTFTKGKLLQPPQWEDVLSYDASSLTLKQPALLDFGAAGKGYLVDIIGETLEQMGISAYLINAGGDLRYRSSPTDVLDVGMENPKDTTEAIGIVHLRPNHSLCASAGSKRAWGDFHHIIDPVELESPRNIIATWVIATDTMLGDGLATALFFTPAQELTRHFTFEYAVLNEDMTLEQSKHFSLTAFEAV